jgi:cellulase/cellobiase CelA1
VTPTSEQEIAVVHETKLAAVRHEVNVRAEITDKMLGNDGRAGWYSAGVAYFVRAEINSYPVLRMRELAVHEVCHAWQSKGGYVFAHDTRHWCCMKLDGEIGYPPPVTPGGQWPVCG